MIKAVLFDLDNTLLGNSNAVFVPEYLRLADSFFSQLWQLEDVSQALIQATRAMIAPRDPRQSNTALAESVIAQAAQRSVDEVRAAFATFYAEVYPQLHDCVHDIPLATEIVEFARAQDLAVVIATNPLYPETAILQRLAWAGVDSDLAFVTHSDNMHFAKPDPAYYAEIIARVGVEPDEAIMVGDSPHNDIVPATTLGLSTFLVIDTATSSPSDAADYSGTLADFFERMRNEDWPGHWQPRPLTIEAIEPQYEGNLGALFGLLGEVKPNQWNQHPDPNEWSIMQIVCHLLESEQAVQRPRLQRIFAEENPFLSPPKPPLRDAPPCDDDGIRVVERFLAQRRETVAWLNGLHPQDWQRPARHSIFGPTTLLEMAQFTAQHDRLHISQICQTLGKCAP